MEEEEVEEEKEKRFANMLEMLPFSNNEIKPLGSSTELEKKTTKPQGTFYDDGVMLGYLPNQLRDTKYIPMSFNISDHSESGESDSSESIPDLIPVIDNTSTFDNYCLIIFSMNP